MKTSEPQKKAVKISKPVNIRRVGRLTPLRKVGRLIRKENGSKVTN